MVTNRSFLLSVQFVVESWISIEVASIPPPMQFLVEFWTEAVKFATGKLAADSTNRFIYERSSKRNGAVLGGGEFTRTGTATRQYVTRGGVETTTTFSEIEVEQEMIFLFHKQNH